MGLKKWLGLAVSSSAVLTLGAFSKNSDNEEMLASDDSTILGRMDKLFKMENIERESTTEHS